MTPEQLLEIALRAEAALTYERSEYDAREGVYIPATIGADTGEDLVCPLCQGEGYTEGQRYDSKETLAATVVAYGIGKGLALAEEWVENGPADILALVAEVRQLQQALSILCEREPSKREGDALERKGEGSTGPFHPTGECFVTHGGWTGRRCRRCTRWVWGGPTACERCVAEEERDEARSELAFIAAEYEKANASDLTRDALAMQNVALKASVDRVMNERDEAESELMLHKSDRLRLRAEDLRLRREVERLTTALDGKREG